MEPTPNTGIPPQPQQPSFQAVPDRDIEENKDIAALGYVWILSVFVFMYKRNSPFVLHHSRQGIVLFVLSILFWMIPVAGRFLELIVLAFMIMGFLSAAQGKYSPLPLIYAMSHGDMKMLRQSWKVVVDRVVSMWHKMRSHHPSANIKVSVQTTDHPSNPVPPVTPVTPVTPEPTPSSATPPTSDSGIPPTITL